MDAFHFYGKAKVALENCLPLPRHTPPWKDLNRTSGLLVLASFVIYFVLTFLFLL